MSVDHPASVGWHVIHEDLGLTPDHERAVANLSRGCGVRGFTVSSLYRADWVEKLISDWSDVEQSLAAHARFMEFCESRGGTG
jgi:hypothetical protein